MLESNSNGDDKNKHKASTTVNDIPSAQYNNGDFRIKKLEYKKQLMQTNDKLQLSKYKLNKDVVSMNRAPIPSSNTEINFKKIDSSSPSERNTALSSFSHDHERFKWFKTVSTIKKYPKTSSQNFKTSLHASNLNVPSLMTAKEYSYPK